MAMNQSRMMVIPKAMVTHAARVAHEVNRAYCESTGDTSQTSWRKAPKWQRESAVKGVQFLIRNRDATPAAMHQEWVNNKAADGWRFGEKKDAEAKTHPCMVAYEQLPQVQRVKDALFQAAVKAVLGM